MINVLCLNGLRQEPDSSTGATFSEWAEEEMFTTHWERAKVFAH